MQNLRLPSISSPMPSMPSISSPMPSMPSMPNISSHMPNNRPWSAMTMPSDVIKQQVIMGKTSKPLSARSRIGSIGRTLGSEARMPISQTIKNKMDNDSRYYKFLKEITEQRLPALPALPALQQTAESRIENTSKSRSQNILQGGRKVKKIKKSQEKSRKSRKSRKIKKIKK